MLVLALLALLRLPMPRGVRIAVIVIALLGGLAGFGWKYHQFFERGATSVRARTDYWEAAFSIAKVNPLFGTGPGTFKLAYQRIKRPESEIAGLVHNDYLEQASDSGFPACVLFTLFVVGLVIYTTPAGFPSGILDSRRKGLQTHDAQASPTSAASMPSASALHRTNWTWFAIWLGLLGWALQQTFEFGLYIPALAWTAFAFMGLLMARAAELKAMDKPDSAH